MPSASFQPIADATISSDLPTTVFSHDQLLSVGWNSDLLATRTILHFDISSLGNVHVSSATLRLYINEHATQPSQALVRRITRTDMDFNFLTWNNYRQNSPWTTAGGDYDATGVTWALPSDEKAPYKDISISTFVSDAINNQSGQLRLLLLRSTEASTNSVAEFYALEDEDPYDPYIPGTPATLTIQYSTISGGGGSPSNKPTTTSLVGGSEITYSFETSSSFGTKEHRNDAGGSALRKTTIDDPNTKGSVVIRAGSHVNVEDGGKTVTNETVGSLDVTVRNEKTIVNNKVGSLDVTEKKTKKGVTIVNNKKS